MSDNPSFGFAANAAGELAQLERLVCETQARLNSLQRQVAAAESQLGSMPAVQMVEANEQLVLAAVRALAEADAASRALEQVSRAASLDPLTGLPNRRVFFDRLAHAIPNARRRGTQLALLYVDLNSFKQINDTLGHAVGDAVLKRVADHLTACVREGDTVSRIGGDEFVFLLGEVTHAADAVVVADKLIAALATPGQFDGHVLRLTASIGISLYPDDGDDAHTLLGRADTAMYRAKRLEKGNIVFFGEQMDPGRHLNPPSMASLRRPMTPLEGALAEQERLNAQLRDANEQLVLTALSAGELHGAAQQALQRQTELLARVAHELRSPLAPISNAVAVLGMMSTPAPQLLQMQAILKRQVVRMTSLIGDLVDVSRTNTGKLRIKRELVDVVDIVDAAIEVSRPAMDARLQHFVARVPSSPMKIDADPLRLSQVFINLLDNASKYTPTGGQICLSVESADRVITVTVVDSGIGIPEEALATLFEPFVQHESAVKFNPTGLGIGLTLVRALVEEHGGEVFVRRTSVGQGSEFVVTLPGQ